MRSLLAPWIGGASDGTATTTQGGYRSFLAFWAGGATSVAPSTTNAGYRSLFAFWAGGASAVGGTETTGGGKVHYSFPYQSYKKLKDLEDQIQDAETEVQAVKAELQKTKSENKTAYLIDAVKKDQQEAIRLAVLELKFQAEIRRLLEEKARLIRLIDDEEAVIALLLASPFIH